jgi:hypothetical protein
MVLENIGARTRLLFMYWSNPGSAWALKKCVDEGIELPIVEELGRDRGLPVHVRSGFERVGSWMHEQGMNVIPLERYPEALLDIVD